MHVLVTGGAGFIGSHLVDAFLDRGDQVAVVDDLSAGSAARLDEHVLPHTCSVADTDRLSALIEEIRPALVCHLAAQIDVRASVMSPTYDAQVNVVGTVNVLEAARKVGARVLLCSSGGALYGREVPAPSPETEAPAPESPYGTAKYCAEQYAGLYNRLHGTNHSVLRLANVYGPRQDPSGEGGVFGIFCSRALAGKPPTIYGDGKQTRDFVYVGDVVAAFLAAADTEVPGTWNIGTGTETSVLDLAAVIDKISGSSIEPVFAPPRLGELQRSVLEVDLARRDLGWTAATSLPDGVEAVYRWIESGAPWRTRS
jgi:UDP-glucose 4-epimerase